MNTQKKKHPLAECLVSEKNGSFAVSVLAIILTIVTASVLLLIMGKNPLLAFISFLRGCGFLPKAAYGGGSGMLSDLFDFLNYLAPMLLAALAFIVGFKAGLFNIGIAGQMLTAGYVATVLVGYNKSLPAAVAKPLVIIVGIIAGGLMGALIGFLKYRFNIHEVVSTIMVNYIISYLTGFFINNRYVDMVTRTSRICTAQARLTWTNVIIGGVKCKVPLGIVIAVIMAFAVQFIFDRTTFGFELKAVGQNKNCAKYIGIHVGSRIVESMAFSGILAGLAGVTYYLGYTNTMIPKALAGMGYDSIAVALLANSSPVGAILASVIVSIFQQGANYMSSTIGVAKEIASLITGILLLYASCGGFMKELAQRTLQKDVIVQAEAKIRENSQESIADLDAEEMKEAEEEAEQEAGAGKEEEK